MKYLIYIFRFKLFSLTLTSLLLTVSMPEQAFSQSKTKVEYNNMITIDKKLLQKAAKENAYIGIIVVTSTEIAFPGTRGEMAYIKVQVQDQLHGPNNVPIGTAFYTSEGKTLLEEGKKYLVVLRDVAHVRPYLGMEAYQELNCDDCTEIVNAYKTIINDK